MITITMIPVNNHSVKCIIPSEKNKSVWRCSPIYALLPSLLHREHSLTIFPGARQPPQYPRRHFPTRPRAHCRSAPPPEPSIQVLTAPNTGVFLIPDIPAQHPRLIAP